MGIAGGIALLAIMGLVFVGLIVLALLGALVVLAVIGVFTLAMIGALAYVIGRLLRLW